MWSAGKLLKNVLMTLGKVDALDQNNLESSSEIFILL